MTYIFSFQWDTALPYPSIRRMSLPTGYSTVQLHNIKSELVEIGYLRLVRRIATWRVGRTRTPTISLVC